MDSFKKSEDWSKGRNDREIATDNLNKYLSTFHLKIEWDKSEFGLTYFLRNINSKSKKIPLYIRFSNDFGFFIKIPLEYIRKPEDYLELISSYSVLYVKRDEQVYDLYANLLTVKYIMENSTWKMEQSKSNKNRLQFNFKIDTLKYRNPTESELFDNTIIEQIINLIHKK